MEAEAVTGTAPRRTALYDRHVALGARMVDFAGWLLPVQYPTGPTAEHLAVRHAAGIFDIDHMGQVVVSGRDAMAYLQQVMTADIESIPVGTAGYAPMCYADGTVVDDTFVYRLPDRFFVAINASNNGKDTAWMRRHLSGYDVRLDNVSERTYMLALQGPQSAGTLQPLCAADLASLGHHGACDTAIAGAPALVGRSGYTGEDGFELFVPVAEAPRIWDLIMESGRPSGIVPVGLAARDSLRFECCMPLYGQEISAGRTPISAGLGWAVALDKAAFIGREALLKERLEGSTDRLVGFRMTEGGVPRHGYPVHVDGVACGEVTSGMYAPSVDAFLGMAYIPSRYAAVGTRLGIAIRDKVRAAVVVSRPFYRRG
jgi:aminomethyltransferase